MIASSTIGGFCAADIVSDHNKSADPPYYSPDETDCTTELFFKPVKFFEIPASDNHSYIVVTDADGSRVELRGGTEKRGPAGNPFSCPDSCHKWGAVVPYMGKHGKLADSVYYPDGDVVDPSGRTVLGPGAQPNVCAMANCVMTVMRSLGQSCKKYILGARWMRNSNTMVSQALASRGTPDGRTSGLTASGWGPDWDTIYD